MVQQFDSKKTIFIIDGSSFLYRAYYGMRPVHTSTGEPVQAVYNFCRMIKKLIDQYQPEHLLVAWDSKGKTERHELFPEYKATRQPPPRDLFDQKARIVEFADLVGLAQIHKPGVEADDIMYSIARDWVQKKFGEQVVIITADKDMAQTIDQHTVILDWFKNQFLDEEGFEQQRGFPVEKLRFYHALLGDSSDNIPGVAGIGKVSATALVQQFRSLSDLYENIDQVKKERIKKILLEHRDAAFLSEQLFILRYHDLHIKKIDLMFDAGKWPQAGPLFRELEFKTLLKDMAKYGDVPKQKPLSQLHGYQFITIVDRPALENLCAKIEKRGVCAIDTETDSLRALQCNLVGVSFCIEPGTAYYVPCGHETIEQQMQTNELVDIIKPILKDESIKKYFHHAKFDQLVFSQYGIEVEGVVFDTLIAAHLVAEDWQRVGLKHLSNFYLNETMTSFGDAVTGNGYKTFAQVPIDTATEYAAADAHQTFRLVEILKKKLNQLGMQELYETIELPLVQILIQMERDGIAIDLDVLKQLDSYVTRDLEIIEKKILVAIGNTEQGINLNSPKQLEKLLFFDLKLPPQKKTKTGYSTDQEVLEALSKLHPIPRMIITYRELFKLKSTYIDALPTYVNPRDGKIHTTFRQTAVATGRLSSSEPNLQNIPVETKQYPVHVRSAFKAEKEYLFISADYSQIELRVLAFLSGDKELKEAFLLGYDIHAQTAAKLFDVTLDQVTNEQRQLGKRINFSILYGLTPYGLSKDLGISFKEAQRYIEKYFAQYPAVSSWMDQVIKDTKKQGYVTTHWGRRRYLPGIYEANRQLYELACRVAINTKAQGTAAELMKLGMIKLDSLLRKRFPESRILLQIHDELIIETPQQNHAMIMDAIKSTLEQVVDWEVPLVVYMRSGRSWQDVTK